MNWGHKLTIVILLFLVALGTMVWYASQQTNEMIDDHYYQKELAYQEVINAKQNLNAISGSNIISMDTDGIRVSLPNGTYEELRNGSIELIRPDDSSKDIRRPMQPGTSGQTLIAREEVVKGKYHARLYWENGGTPFHREELVYVP